MSEALKALREAKETLNRLLAQYPTTGITTRRFELNKDLKTEDQESAFESMQNIDDEVFSTLANKFNLEVE